MLKILCLVLLLNQHESHANIFNPITSLDAQTVSKNKFAYGKSPLQNLNSHFILSAINYGILNRVEIGTVPINYFIDEHRYNYHLKYHFYKSENINWALSYGNLAYKFKYDQDNVILRLNAYQLGFNYQFENSAFAIGSTFNRSCAIAISPYASLNLTMFRCENEIGFDLQSYFKNDQWLTLGIGKKRESGNSPYEKVVTGIGLAYTRMYINKFFSRPSIGVYKNGNNLTLLFSSTIYESR